MLPNNPNAKDIHIWVTAVSQSTETSLLGSINIAVYSQYQHIISNKPNILIVSNIINNIIYSFILYQSVIVSRYKSSS